MVYPGDIQIMATFPANREGLTPCAEDSGELLKMPPCPVLLQWSLEVNALLVGVKLIVCFIAVLL